MKRELLYKNITRDDLITICIKRLDLIKKKDKILNELLDYTKEISDKDLALKLEKIIKDGLNHEL